MRRTPKNVAPKGFIDLLQELMEKRRLSLNQLAGRAGISPAFLSRILNRQRGLPSDETILRLAEELDLQPPELLLIEAGHISEEMRHQRSVPALLRAVGILSEDDLRQVVRVAEALALKQKRGGK